MAWTASTGRRHFDVRAGIVFDDAAGLAEDLAALSRGARSAVAGRGTRGASLLDVMFAEPAAALDDTRWTQPALYALECALTAQWRSLGVEPVAVLGHSVGELAAAFAAGVLSLDDGLRFAAAIGSAQGSGLSIAADNGTHRVVSGPAATVRALADELGASGLRTELLRTSHAFHSGLMEPVLDELEALAASLPAAPPELALVSNVTGRELEAAPDGGYWRRQAREEVAFAAGVSRLAELGVEVLVEVGPQAVLTRMAQALWPGEPPPCVASLTRPAAGSSASGLSAIAAGSCESRESGFPAAAAAAWEAGLPLRLEGLFAGERRRRITLPTYPFQRRRHWVDGRARRGRADDHPLLGARTELAGGGVVFEIGMAASDPEWLADHRVFGRLVAPGALYGALAASAVAPLGGSATVEALQIHSPLIFEDEDTSRRFQIALGAPDDNGQRTLEIFSRSGRDAAWVLHVEGRVREGADLPERTPPEVGAFQPFAESPSEIYAAAAGAGLDLGPSFQVLRSGWRGPGEAISELSLPPGLAPAEGLVHPVLLDGMFQTVATAGEMGDALYLPFGWDGLRLRGPVPERLTCHVRQRDPGGAGNAGDAGPELRTADIDLYDERGHLVGEVSGYRTKRASRQQLFAAIEGVDDLLYETVWRSVAEPGGRLDASFLRSPWAIAAGEAAGPEPWLVAEGIDPTAPAILEEALERLAAGYARQALNALDWRPGPERDAGALRAGLKVVQSQESLLGRVLALATAADDDPEPDTDPAGLAASLAERHAFGAAEIGLLAHCGEPLAEVLRGRCYPVALLFGEAGAGAAALYRESPMLRASNRLLASAVASMVDDLPAGRTLRVLEIGGGTGATTETVLDALPAGRFQYTFTDISAAFLDAARRRFEDHSPALDVLDIERDLVAQGFAAHGFDLVIAANVLHATRDLGESLGHCRRLLAPEGGLVLLEGLAPQGWLDLTFGLLEGWWRHSDEWRSDGPLIDEKGWHRALAAAGFGEVEVLATSLDRTGRALQGVILARGPSKVSDAPGTWVIAGPQATPALALARSLVERNQTAIVAGSDVPDVPEESSPIRHLRLELERREAWRALLWDLPDEAPFTGVVLLAGTEQDGSDPAVAADRVSARALALV